MQTSDLSAPQNGSNVNCVERTHNDMLVVPVKEKNVRPIVRSRLLSSLRYPNPLNPLGTLLALVEPSCFYLDISNVGERNFKARITIGGRMFESVASQKRKARDMAVVNALNYIFRDSIQEISLRFEKLIGMEHSSIKPELTSAEARARDIISLAMTYNSYKRSRDSDEEENQTDLKRMKILSTESVDRPGRALVKKEIKESVLNRVVEVALGFRHADNPNTVTALHSLFGKDTFSFEGGITVNDDGKFVTKLNIQGQMYTGVGRSNKDSKTDAAKKALRDLFPDIVAKYETPNATMEISMERNAEDSVSSVESNIIPPNNLSDSAMVSFPTFNLNQESNIADQVASAIQTHYNQIVAPFETYLKRYSIISGIVMSEGDAARTMKIICITTGNKCLRGDLITTRGDVVLDCHAEILARRCFIRFLYSQFELAFSGEESILEEIGGNRFRVKKTVKFYLYVNSSPCGDGRVFNFSTSSPQQSMCTKQLSKRGMLRVKLESGMGGIPVNEYANLTQTYEGYIRGRPLVLMCCSAKLMRANLLGMQGALLSHFMQPVYLEGVLIGDVFQKENLERALYGRISDMDKECAILPPYRPHNPLIEGITNSSVPTNVKAGKSCMNWIIGDPEVEFINTKTGKTLQDGNSRLCKLSLLNRFVDLLGPRTNLKKSTMCVISYESFKQRASDYQEMRKTLFEFLERTGHGTWVQKPRELNFFFPSNKSE